MERLHYAGTLEQVRHESLNESSAKTFVTVTSSPVGELTLIATNGALTSLLWGQVPSADSFFERNEILKQAVSQLEEYFEGERSSFTVPLAPKGTEFQKRVWEELLKIAFGKFITYGEQANCLGNPKAARAVGAANGRNPIGIMIPCHRVIGSTGHLTGFAGGLRIKAQLLELEAAVINGSHSSYFNGDSRISDTVINVLNSGNHF